MSEHASLKRRAEAGDAFAALLLKQMDEASETLAEAVREHFWGRTGEDVPLSSLIPDVS